MFYTGLLLLLMGTAMESYSYYENATYEEYTRSEQQAEYGPPTEEVVTYAPKFNFRNVEYNVSDSYPEATDILECPMKYKQVFLCNIFDEHKDVCVCGFGANATEINVLHRCLGPSYIHGVRNGSRYLRFQVQVPIQNFSIHEYLFKNVETALQLLDIDPTDVRVAYIDCVLHKPNEIEVFYEIPENTTGMMTFHQSWTPKFISTFNARTELKMIDFESFVNEKVVLAYLALPRPELPPTPLPWYKKLAPLFLILFIAWFCGTWTILVVCWKRTCDYFNHLNANLHPYAP